MVYHFVKHVDFDIKADSLEQAKKIAEAIDNTDSIENIAYDTLLDAIDDVLDVESYDSCDAHTDETVYVGCTEDEDDPEERLYDYLTNSDNTKEISDTDRIAENLANTIRHILNL